MLFEIVKTQYFLIIFCNYVRLLQFFIIYKMPLEDFQISGDLGKGSFGCVVKCIRRSDGQIYAMKQVTIIINSDKITKA